MKYILVRLYKFKNMNRMKKTKEVFNVLMASVCILLCMTAGVAPKKVWNVKDYGAVADGKTVNTVAIQKAIDECSAAGGGTVLVEGGVFVSGSLLIKDNVCLHVSEKTTIQASVNPNDYAFTDPFIDATGQFRGHCLIGMIDVKNVSLTGKGVIDGQGEMFTHGNIKKTVDRLGITLRTYDFSTISSNNERYASKTIRMTYRPFLVRICRSVDVRLKDIELRQPGAWTCHLFQASNFDIDGVKIYSHANVNNDGIDIDSSSNGVIRNTHIDSGDDAICFKSTSPLPSENVLVEKCRLKSRWGAIKFGTESMGDYRNIIIRDCHIYDTEGGGIKMLSVDGANIDNVLIENITMDNVEMPLFMRLGERGLTYRGVKKLPVGSIKNVTIRNIQASVRELEECRLKPTSAIYLTGTPNHKIGNIKLENISIELPGGGQPNDAKIIVPENELQYPEYVHLGVTPAYGIYGRHIESLEVDDITFKLRYKDLRKENEFIDIDKQKIDDVSTQMLQWASPKH